MAYRLSRAKKRRRLKRILAPVIAVMAAAGLYLFIAFTGLPLIAYWRGIWIETAMTTGDHQWLATRLFPQSVIDEAMNGAVARNEDIIGGSEWLETKDPDGETLPPAPEPTMTGPEDNDSSPYIDEPSDPLSAKEITDNNANPNEFSPLYPPPDNAFHNTEEDILGLAYLAPGLKDYAGNAVETVDIAEGLYIAEVSGSGYKGKVMLIDDPGRIFVGRTIYSDQGTRIRKMAESYNAVAGINASGFPDPDGSGDGRMPMGTAASGGTIWGQYVNFYGSVVFTDSDKLVVGNIAVWSNYAIRDGIQFGPILIADGKSQVSGSSGFGIQPRTAIGQREDGVVVMLVIDGRDPLHSLGATVGDCADILSKYGCVNAACCDGGSSSVMAYGGVVINRNCSLNPEYGRRLPNAFLVRSKSEG